MSLSRILALAFCLALAPALASAREYRSQLRKARVPTVTSPAPRRGARPAPCPRYIKDHIRALDCGGPDAVENMQWQTAAAAKAKVKWERKSCAR